ncbi:MAG TPA: DUF1080 domain-containing protein [Verrucomicrobiota bacterium]|nr:DUF1080 domain-containing protein [Verrucomicrobiota bacterium]
MHPTLRTLLLISFVLSGCATKPPQPVARPLFNGHNLAGWVVMFGGEWTVADGVIVGRNGVDWSTNPEKSGSWLRTDREYGDFILELEYAINAKGNSGIFLRSALEKNPAFTGNEMQILDDRHLAKPEIWSTGALYDVVAASKVMSKPAGEWNQVRIEARGLRVNIWLNGEQILREAPLRSTRGYLGLQNHDDKSVVQFRNIRLTELR